MLALQHSEYIVYFGPILWSTARFLRSTHQVTDTDTMRPCVKQNKRPVWYTSTLQKQWFVKMDIIHLHKQHFRLQRCSTQLYRENMIINMQDCKGKFFSVRFKCLSFQEMQWLSTKHSMASDVSLLRLRWPERMWAWQVVTDNKGWSMKHTSSRLYTHFLSIYSSVMTQNWHGFKNCSLTIMSGLQKKIK